MRGNGHSIDVDARKVMLTCTIARPETSLPKFALWNWVVSLCLTSFRNVTQDRNMSFAEDQVQQTLQVMSLLLL
jgi:hypothetical protein